MEHAPGDDERACRPARCGDYELGDEIGRGGMGTVYSARGPGGEQVAVKLLHGSVNRERFRREAEAGLRIEHANVVRTLASGTVSTADGARAWLAMELVRGRTLRELLNELDTVPEALLREIAVQAADGLAAIHSAGIVHRDIKPDNILLTDDDRVRIMDLGVAKLAADTLALTRHGQFVGSLHYAAPEQCDRGAADERTDLYALGVTLYELATGANPFRRDGAAAVLRAHLEIDPLPARDVAEVSPFFSAVLARLLAKRPLSRFAGAAELGEVLAAGEDGPWWREHPTERAPAVVIPVRRETRLHGRADELLELREAWDEACAGRGGAILVLGEAGLGKSRFVDTFARGLGGDARVLYGSFPPGGGFAGLGDAFDTVTTGPIAAFFHEGEQTDGDVLEAACCRQLREWAEEGPLLWIVDDLHFAPARARQIVAALARTAANRDALLVVTARERSCAADLPADRSIALGRLSPREVVELLRDAFASERLADRLGARIAYKSDGIPFFVFEMIRGLKEGGFLERQADGSYIQTRVIDEIEVPSAVRDLVAARLSALQRDERALLDVAAVLGYEFDVDLLAAVAERPRVRVLQTLAEVERRHGVVRTEARRYRFDHHQIQEVVYADLPEPLREEYHALLAAAGRDAGRGAAFTAYHGLFGARPEEAADELPAGLAELDRQHAYERAAQIAERALAAPGLIEGEMRVRMLNAHVGRLGLLGRREEQQRAAAAALETAEDAATPAALALAHRAASAYAWSVGEVGDSLHHARLDLENAARAGESRLLAAAHNNLGVALRRTGSYEEALPAFEASADIAESLGQDDVATTARSNHAITLVNLGRLEAACESYEALLDEGPPRSRGLAYAHAGYGLALYYLGRYDEARVHHEAQRAFVEKIGDEHGHAIVAGNLALVDLDQGRYDEAERWLRRQRELGLELEHGRPIAHAHLNTAALADAVGRIADRNAAADEALAVTEQLGDARLGAYARLYRGDAEPALAVFRKMKDALGIAEASVTLGRFDEVLELAERADVRSATIRAFARSGRRDEARAFLDRCGTYLPLHDRLEAHTRLGDETEVERLLAGVAKPWRDDAAARLVRLG